MIEETVIFYFMLNPIQARLFLSFKGPKGGKDPLMISGTIKASPMKL